MISVCYQGRVSLQGLRCDLVFSVLSNSSGLLPRGRSRTSGEELSGGFCLLALTCQQQLARNQNKAPAQKSSCNLWAVPCSVVGLVPCTCQASELLFCYGLLPEDGMLSEVPMETVGGKPCSAPTWGIVQRCQDKVVALKAVMHRNHLFKRFLLFKQVVWYLCSKAVPSVELKFDALFFFFCSVLCE